MSTSLYFDWPTARLAGFDGHPVRRRAWTDRWVYFYNGLWWLMPESGEARVVTTQDFGVNDFKATDWTNLSPACVSSSPDVGGGAAACPAPFDPAAPLQGPYKTSGSSFTPQ